MNVKISRLHIHSDVVGVTLEDLNRGIKVPRKQKTTAFIPPVPTGKVITRRRGKLKEVQHTKTFGSEKYHSYKTYDSSTRHGFPIPTSRVSEEINHPRWLPIQHPRDFPALINIELFKGVTIHSIRPAEALPKKLRRFYRSFLRAIDDIGIQDAIAEFRVDDPKHFDERFKAIKALLTPIPVNLNAIFRKSLKRFLDAKASPEEKEMLGTMLRVQKRETVEKQKSNLCRPHETVHRTI